MMINIEKDIRIKDYQGFKKKKSNKQKILYIILCGLFINLFCYFKYFNRKINKILNLSKVNNENMIYLKAELSRKIQKLESKIKLKDNLDNNTNSDDLEYNIFDRFINNKYREKQLRFCQGNNLFNELEIENNIKKIKINFNNIEFQMFVYKINDVVSQDIINGGNWEGDSTTKILAGLDYYSEIKKLPKNEITVVDIGANIGWYSFYLGKAGYEIISFEASSSNNYLLNKNFCLNEDVNITIINRAIGLEEKKCFLHHPSDNIGNAVILCGENTNIIPKNYYLSEEIKFTRLSKYVPFLSKKNLAFIKLDIEGSEGIAINSGFDLISKYHIPFILIEFTPNYLKMQGTDPKVFLETLEKNGYKMSTIDFLSKKYSTIDEIIKLSSINLYIIYTEFLK